MKSINNGKEWEENDIPGEDHQDFQVSEATTKLMGVNTYKNTLCR